ncbi:sugar transferase [Natronococcus occultus]|uniref:Glycosyl transferase possibly involved in lipopolysaccharide synthesis n=1 Tax=Natronococcus occultus SP4 TaxID=694430 RepID=L0K432_9EURY|nr:sugar transferase [Natronococcus occultus]AGB39290.1 glycosyl transferase possibly involved in lipopolysaccharide synthesis [Natronococcus occultus SP4]
MEMRQWNVYDLSGQEPVAIVGDDQDRLEDALDEFGNAREIRTNGGVVLQMEQTGNPEVEQTDGPVGGRVRELEEFERVLVDRNVGCVVLAFRDADRHRFFGTLRACRRRNIEAVVHPDHASKVISSHTHRKWAAVNFDPFTWQQWALKRAFDVVFATVGLVTLAPLIAIIILGIKMENSGPVLYTQRRTGLLGTTFQLPKFRTMFLGSEDAKPETDEENDRITSTGRLLRKSHMDEIPQLWSIFRGEMSAVGPRAAWIEEERLLEREVEEWQQRWFVKPGLTGLAQINGVDSTDAEAKLHYDLQYIERQSFLLDVWLVRMELKSVLFDALSLLRNRAASKHDAVETSTDEGSEEGSA